jgi:NhaP-type Na+/H+ or K+/H+ antiporter
MQVKNLFFTCTLILFSGVMQLCVIPIQGKSAEIVDNKKLNQKALSLPPCAIR